MIETEIIYNNSTDRVANSHNLSVFLEINKCYFSVIEKLREKYKDNEDDE